VVPDLRLRLGPQDSNDQAENNQGLPLLPGDVLVLCSDGLTDLVDDPEILETLETKSLESALSQLVDLANQRGGHDNITVIALQIPPIGTAPVRMPTLEETKPLALAAMSSDVTQQIKRSDLSAVQKEPSPSRKIIIITCLSISSLIILAAGVFGAFSWLAILSGQATDTPTRPAEQSSATATELASPRPTQTFTAVSSITASANTPQPPQATLTPWPTNTLTAPSKTPPNPFITSIVTTLTMSH
jgi:sulfur transfer complex TusBCD TusB component (DsrH family)